MQRQDTTTATFPTPAALGLPPLMRPVRTRPHDLTVTSFFAAPTIGIGQTIVGVTIKSAVLAFEATNWKRVKGAGGVKRYKLAGQSRCVIRFRNPRTKRYATLVFSLGEARVERVVA